MSIIGNCIRTGAVVEFIEYGQAFAADLFKVGDAVLIRFGPEKFDYPVAFSNPRPATHRAYVGSNGFLDKRAGYAIVTDVHLIEVA